MSAPASEGAAPDESAASVDRDRREQIIATISASWPDGYPDDVVPRAIDCEVQRFLVGHGASLPYFTRDAVAWVTVGPSATALHWEVQLLRAWVIPSYAWEDPEQPFIVPGEGSGRLSKDLLAASPAGYFRWRCATADYPVVADRLSRMRALLARRPEHVHDRVPSLLELRQQFRIALVTGARDASESAIRAIDHYQLDSAVNTHLMRVQMLDCFGEYAAIVEDPAMERLLGLRLPQAIRTAVVRAFHAVYVAPREEHGTEAAAAAFAERVHPAVGGLLALSVPEDGPEIGRCLAYRALVNGDSRQAEVLLPTADDFVLPLLRSLVESQKTSAKPENVIHAFHAAIARGDLRAIQALAPELLSGQRGSADLLAGIADVVRGSLEVLPNAKVAAELTQASGGSASPPTMPQTWVELLERLRIGDVIAAERFLELGHAERPDPEQLSTEERWAAVATLEELLTDPAFGADARERWIIDSALPAFVEDFVSEPGFPRPELAPLYVQLFRLWAEHKRGSAYAPDGQVLLMLSFAVVQHAPGVEQEVAQSLIDWWSARPVPAALPFLLEALEVVLDYTAADAPAQQLWLDGAVLASRQQEGLSVTEHALWRHLGRRAGFDDATIAQVLPRRLTETAAETPDPLRQAGLQKIAIVSLHRRAADEARALIAERSGATVIVVDETVAGPATKSAQSADVILVVWAATKHAVFRAFDRVRDRVVYVQGSGAGSIVLALERSAVQRMGAMV